MTVPDFSLEDTCPGFLLAGIDEAGRGALAGPVVAAAVCLPQELRSEDWVSALDDSKRLNRRARERLACCIRSRAIWRCGAASVAEITRLNILQASLLAMQRAASVLPVDGFLVDGIHAPQLECRYLRTVKKGDQISASIAAASILAKTVRDRLMRKLALLYPAYHWEYNAGYGTKAHLGSLKIMGASPHHRSGFAPLKRGLS